MISIKSLRKGAGTAAPQAAAPAGLFVPDEPARADDLSDVTDVLEAGAQPASQPSAATSFNPGLTKRNLGHLFSRKKPSGASGSDETATVEDAVEVLVQPGQADALDPTEGAKPQAEKKLSWKERRALKANTVSTGAVSLPIQIIMGYLPEVSNKDAVDYAMGMCEKYVTQQGLAYFYVTKYDRGFIYEVHEGGDGRAYGPEIAAFFSGKPLSRDEAPLTVVLNTATRKVEVQQQREGVSVVLLPESSEQRPTEGLLPRASMKPAVSRRQGLLVAGAVVLVSGVLMATLTGYFFRLQGYQAPPAPVIDHITSRNLPHVQWELASKRLPPKENVRAFRFENGAWQAPELFSSPPRPPATTAATPVPEARTTPAAPTTPAATN